MYVCVEDEGAPRIVGWTSLEAPHEGNRVRFAGLARPRPDRPNERTFAIRRVYETSGRVMGRWPDRVILLAEGDDPAVLPGWRPMQERIVAVYARRRSDGVDLQLSRISMADLTHLAAMHIPRILAHPPGEEGSGDLGFAPEVPLYWAEADHGHAAIHPAASDEYEIIVQRERRFTFEKPRVLLRDGVALNSMAHPQTLELPEAFFEEPQRPLVFGDTGRRTVAWSEPHDPALWGDSIRVIGDATHGELIAAMEADLRRFMAREHHRLMVEALDAGTHSNIPGPGLTLEALNQSIEEARAAMHMRGFQSELQQAALTTEYQRYQQYAAQQQAAFIAQQDIPAGALGRISINAAMREISQAMCQTLGLPADILFNSHKAPDPAAVTRSRGLLRRLVGPEQWREFERDGKITERIGNREYVIRPGGMIDVRAVRRTLLGGKRSSPRLERWCVNPDAFDGDARLPPEDQAIAQLLHLRADPARLRAQANVFR